ncbi:MAG: hypothetical protein WD825_14920 [Gemmatimonadaceae bacterium]
MEMSLRCSLTRLSTLVCLVMLPAIAVAQDEKAKDQCMTLDEQASVDNVNTIPQLKFNAMQSARNRLLQSLGVEVRGTTEILRGGTRDSSYTVMTMGISQETTGWITQDTILDWRTLDGGRTYTMKYHGCARTSVGKRDPSFFAEVTLDKDPATYVDNGPGRRDSIVVFAKVSQPAFLSVFFRTGDTLTVLYPSTAVGAPERVHLGTGGELRVPPPGNRLRTSLTGGNKKTIDWIVVVATKQDVPLSIGADASDAVTLKKLTWREYLAWLNRIPLEERFVVEKPFSIERTR